MVTNWDHFYFCTTPVDKLAAVVANQRNCGEQIIYDSRMLRIIVQLVDANTAVTTATPTIVKAMAGITRPKKFRLSSLDDLQKVRRRLLKRGRAADAKVVSIFMGLVSKVGHLHKEVREKQKELGVLNNISSRQTARVVKGKVDAIQK